MCFQFELVCKHLLISTSTVMKQHDQSFRVTVCLCPPDECESNIHSLLALVFLHWLEREISVSEVAGWKTKSLSWKKLKALSNWGDKSLWVHHYRWHIVPIPTWISSHAIMFNLKFSIIAILNYECKPLTFAAVHLSHRSNCQCYNKIKIHS